MLDKVELTKEDEMAVRRMHSVRPVWRGVELVSDAMEFPARTILHAGPPIHGEIALPILKIGRAHV